MTTNPSEFVRDLVAYAESHRAVNHPYLLALADGSLPDPQGALLDFGIQYLAYSNNFARYLTGAITQLRDISHRKALVENLAEESGHLHDEDRDALRGIGIDPAWVDGVSHPTLFRRFLAAMGVDVAQAPVFCDEAMVWTDVFLRTCSHSGSATAVGALGPGTESIVKHVYKHILRALDRHTDLSRYDRVFFDLHAELDDEHGEILNEIAASLADSDDDRKALRVGVVTALHLREAFFDAMHRRAVAMPSRHVSKSNGAMRTTVPLTPITIA